MSSGENITQASPKDKAWNIHKTENVEVGRLYGLEPRFERYSERMAGCADWLEFGEVREHDKRMKLTRASFCHVRHCPICQWRKGLARIARFMHNLPAYLADSPDWVYIFVTLTTRNCDFDQLRATIRAQNDGVKKLLKRRELKGIAKGYIRTNEVTLGKDGLAHPHIHLILAVPRSYFGGKFYIRQKRWVGLWREVMGLDYDPRVNVKRVKMTDKKKAEFREKEGREPTASDELVSGIVEVSKYSVKPEDMAEDAEYLYAVTAQCFRLRFLATGGCLKDIFKDGARDAEDISDEEMLRPGTEEEPEKASAWRRLYLWQHERRGYLLRLRRKAAPDPLLDSLEFQEGLTEAMRERSAERYRQEKPRPEAGSVAGATCPAP